MDTKEQLNEAREQFKSSVATAFHNLGNYGRAVGEHTSAVIKDKVVDFPATQAANYYLRQEAKEQERLEEERIRAEERAREEAIRENTREHEIGMREALKEQDRKERETRRLAFRNSIIEKVSSAKGRLGRIKNNLLEKLNPSNLDVKFRDFVEKVEIKGLEIANKSKEAVIEARDKVVDFASMQVANYYLNQEAKEQERLEEERIRAEERAREEAIRKNTREHEIGMKAALKEKDRKRILAFKNGVIEKTNSVKSKLGRMKNNLIEKISNAKNKVNDFFVKQVADYYLRQEEKASAKEFRDAASRVEKEELEKAREQLITKKSDMIAALNTAEREMYEKRHIDNVAKKEELMKQLFGEKEELELAPSYRTF